MNIIQEKYNWNGSLKYGNRPSEIIVHHAEHPSCTVADIHRWHVAKGWTGIGYHYVIYKDGSIHTGRPESAIGAHAPGHNSKSIGICFVGSYMKEIMPEAQLNAGIWLINNIRSKYSSSMSVKGHREVNPTDCPGSNFPMSTFKSGSFSNSTGAQNDTSILLMIGSKGQHVYNLQKNLMLLGYSLPRYGADSSYGNETYEAVKRFQRDNNLLVDGKAGTNTLRKINAMVSSSNKTYTVNTHNTGLNVRDNPNGNIISSLSKGSKVYELERRGGWSNVICGGVKGWVSNKYLA